MTPSVARFALFLAIFAALPPASARAADLVDLYTRAGEFDPAFQAARLERDVAEQAVRESRAGLLPSVTASAESSKSYQDIRESDNQLFSVGTSDFFNNRFSISLTQAVWRADVYERLPQAQAEERRRAALLAAAEQDLAFRVAEAYFDVLASQDELAFTTAERDAIGRQLAETEERLGSGLAKLSDVLDARARFALAEASAIEARDALEEARQAIAEIVGRPVDDLATLSETFPLVEPDQGDENRWVETALFQNPQVKAREAAVEAAEREVRRQRAGRMPKLDLVTTYSDTDTGGTVFGGGNEIGTTDVALRVGVPLYDGGRISALVRTASLRKRIVVQELERDRRRVERETRSSFRGVMNGITRVRALQTSVYAQEAAVAQKEEGLRSGLSTGLDVLDARRDLYAARRDLTRARYVYILNSLRLKQAAGILGAEDLRQINAFLQ